MMASGTFQTFLGAASDEIFVVPPNGEPQNLHRRVTPSVSRWGPSDRAVHTEITESLSPVDNKNLTRREQDSKREIRQILADQWRIRRSQVVRWTEPGNSLRSSKSCLARFRSLDAGGCRTRWT